MNYKYLKILTNIFLFLLSTIPCTFAQSITDASGTEVKVTLNDSSNTELFDLYVVSNEGTSANPSEVYIPIGTDDDPDDNKQYSYYIQRASLPQLNNSAVESGAGDVTFRLDVDIEGDDNEINAAIGSGSSYEIVKILTSTSDVPNYEYKLSISDICSASSVDCDLLDKTDLPQTNFTTNLFIFLSNSLGTGSSIDPSNYSNGVFYKLNLSNRIYDTDLDLLSLVKGDEQLFLDFRGFTMVNYQGLFATKVDLGVGDCEGKTDSSKTETLGSLGLSFSDIFDLESKLTIGKIPLKNLKNGNCYKTRLFHCDFFGFCSKASEEFQNTPENIQTLLEKQSCFFFTAGFGKKHYVVDFFQAWRDNFLMKFTIGREFISFYYKHAPKYTPYILERSWLQGFIRLFAYILYVLIKYWYLISLLLLFSIVHSISKKFAKTSRFRS